MKQLEVQIMGQSYLLGCPEGGDSRLLEAVERVDTAMCKIRDVGKVRARDRIAVLAALNLAFDISAQTDAAAAASALVNANLSPSASSDQALATGGTVGSVSSSLSGSVPGEDVERVLTSLMERLDEALGGDGNLL